MGGKRTFAQNCEMAVNRSVRLCILDFTNLLIAPLAALVTFVAACGSVLVRPRSEDKSLIWAYAASLLLTSVVVQPWYFTNQRALIDSLSALLIMSTFGFAVGAFFAFIIVKGGRALKARFQKP